MRMRLGERLAVTLFGTSHGPCVGALIEGLPSGISVDHDAIQDRMDRRMWFVSRQASTKDAPPASR